MRSGRATVFVVVACAALIAGPAGPCGAQEKGEKAPTAQSPDNRLTATGTDKAITVLDAQTQRELLRLMGHTDRVTALAFTPSGLRSGVASAVEAGVHAEGG